MIDSYKIDSYFIHDMYNKSDETTIISSSLA